jgi:ParB-like chromosome segregation protein Spo0J
MKISEIVAYNIPRKLMPQITTNDLDGVFDYTTKPVNPRSLTPSQEERKFSPKKFRIKNPKPIIVDKEGRIIDGHHRWDAALHQGSNDIDAAIVDAKFDDIVRYYQKADK